jgi:hypothetical protein
MRLNWGSGVLWVAPFFLCAYLGLAGSVGAQEPWRKTPSIPYPSGHLYLDHGLVGVFAGGKVLDVNETKSLFQWQGEFSYFYHPWLSGGVGFRIKAGEPSDSIQKIENRFFFLLRTHYAWKKVAVFIGPQLGVDDLNFRRLADTLSSAQRNASDSLTPNNTGAGLGMELGLGWKPLPWFGFTLGHRFEYALANLTSTSKAASRSFNFRDAAGISVDVLPFVPRLRESVHALYVFAEYQSGFLLVLDERRRIENGWAAGGSIAF